MGKPSKYVPSILWSLLVSLNKRRTGYVKTTRSDICDHSGLGLRGFELRGLEPNPKTARFRLQIVKV